MLKKHVLKMKKKHLLEHTRHKIQKNEEKTLKGHGICEDSNL